MRQHEVDILGLAETNTNWRNGNIYKFILHRIRKGLQDKKAFLYTSDSNIEWTTNYKQGGTAVITTSSITAQTTMKQNDHPYGRWNTITLGPMEHKVTIIVAYIVCNTHIDPTKDKTAAYQQWQLMCNEPNSNGQHPRKRAISDLKNSFNKK